MSNTRLARNADTGNLTNSSYILIVPFPDGNGRTGRLILNLELIRNGYPTISVRFTDRKRYYDAFDTFYRNGKADDMVLLVAEYASESPDQYLEIVKEYPLQEKQHLFYLCCKSVFQEYTGYRSAWYEMPKILILRNFHIT